MKRKITNPCYAIFYHSWIENHLSLLLLVLFSPCCTSMSVNQSIKWQYWRKSSDDDKSEAMIMKTSSLSKGRKKTSALIIPRVTMEERRRSLKAALACPITPNPSQTHHHYHHSCRSQFNPSLLNLTSSQQKITFEKITISYHFMLRAYPFRAFVQWETVWWGAQFSSWWCRLTVFILYLQIINKRSRDIQSYLPYLRLFPKTT